MKRSTLMAFVAVSMTAIVTLLYPDSVDADDQSKKNGEVGEDQNFGERLSAPRSRDQVLDERSRRFLDLMNQGVWQPDCVDQCFIDFLIKRNPLVALEFHELCPDGDLKALSYRTLISSWFSIAPENFLSNMYRIAGTDSERAELIQELSSIGTEVLGNRPPDEYLTITSRLSKLFEDGSSIDAIQSIEEKVLAVVAESNDPATIDAILSGSGFANRVDEALYWRARGYPTQVEEYFTSAGKVVPDAIAKGIVESSIESELMDLRRGVDDFMRFDWKDEVVMNSTGSKLMQFYLNQDSIQASSDIAKLVSGPKKDALIFEMVRWLISKGSHAEARPWVEQVQDDGVREKIGLLRGAN